LDDKIEEERRKFMNRKYILEMKKKNKDDDEYIRK